MTTETNLISKEVAAEKLWRASLVAWKFHGAQLDIYEAICKCEASTFVINCSRQIGKSFMLCGYAIEYAMQHKGAKICYLAPTAKAVKKIIIPRIREILSDCPRDIVPEYKVNDQVYRFKNGSEIHIAGTDAERAENLRGQVFHLVICDEAGFMDKLDYVIASILRPLTITVNGKIILSSTPPISPAHPFKRLAEVAKLANNGSYIKKTIYENPMISEKVRQQYMKDAGGEDSVAWRREFLAEFIIDENEAVIPEANEARVKEMVKDVVPYNPGQELTPEQIMRPAYFDGYTVADLGYTDNTGILFGYWDFYNAYLVIEDEAMFNKPNTQIISNIINQKEFALWNGKKPYARYCDGDMITIGDLNSQHNLSFSKTRNDELESSVNAVRLFVQDNKIRIHPRCINLISQLQSAIWDSTRKKFARSTDHGHYDLIAALIYMVRNVKRSHNPYPANLGLNIESMHFIPEDTSSKNSKDLQKLVTAPMDRFFPNSKDKK